MAKDPNDDMIFQVSSVGKTGITETRKIKAWRKARARYDMLIALPHVRYVIVVDISDMDSNYWTIREEWNRAALSRTEQEGER